MKKFLLIALLTGCAAQIKTVEVVKPCLTEAAPALDDNSKLQIGAIREVNDDIVALLVEKASLSRFSKWIHETLLWEKDAQERCLVPAKK